jgi:phosphoenolpyruvate phosphomutase
MRSCITAMQQTARQVYREQSLVGVEERVAPLAEVFRLQGAPELEEAEKRYLPRQARPTRAVVLGATPALPHVDRAYRAAGVKDVTVGREGGGEVDHLYQARAALEGPCLVSPGEVLFKKYVAEELVDLDADFAVAIEASAGSERQPASLSPPSVRRDEPGGSPGPGCLVRCSGENSPSAFCRPVRLLEVGADPAGAHGEWRGILKVSAEGALFLRHLLEARGEGEEFRKMTLAGLLGEVLRAGREVRVVYTTGHWFAGPGGEGLP